MKTSWIAYALGAVLALSFRGVAQKHAITGLPTDFICLVGGAVSLAVFVVVYFVRGDGMGSEARWIAPTSWACVQGVLSAIGVLLSLAAMRRGPLSLVSSMIALNMAGVAVLAWLVFKERLSLLHVLGIGLMVVGACLLGVKPLASDPSGVASYHLNARSPAQGDDGSSAGK